MRNHTNISFEIFIVVLTVLPFFMLAYFYPLLPEHVPLFLDLRGEVTTWADKSVLSVFRVPLMALDTQLICLLMKYGTIQSGRVTPADINREHEALRKQYAGLSIGLWDWFRGLVAFKMSAASLDTVFLSVERFKFLARPAFAVTGVAALLSIAGALFYGWRLLVVRRDMRAKFGTINPQPPIDARFLYGRVLYFNRNDSAMFVDKYIFNFGNRWAWVLIASFIAYPLIVFSSV